MWRSPQTDCCSPLRARTERPGCGKPTTGERTHSLAVGGGAVLQVGFRPDSAKVITVSQDMAFRLWDDVGGAYQVALSHHVSSGSEVAFSPDGRLLAVASRDNKARLWDTDRPGDAPAALTGHAGAVRWVAFSPDGRYLATASIDKTARIWEL